MFLDYLAIQLDSRKAEGLEFKINLVTPDNGEKFIVELSNATMTTIAGYQADDAALTLTVNRSDLEEIMIGKTKLMEKVQAGAATLQGNPQVLMQLAAAVTRFDPWFEILPGTKPPAEQGPKEELFEEDASIEARP
jgi:alkyl sulfatase BDS1-like metallo-beta-lactamase superfamily hydrolase